MIYGYGSREADWMATAVWILAEFGLFHYFTAKLPKRERKGVWAWAVPILWWCFLTGLQMGQATIPFFYNSLSRIALLTLYIYVTDQASLLEAGYVTLVFYLVKDICKMLLLDVMWPMLHVDVMGDPWLNTGSMALCVAMQLGILRLIKRSVGMEERLRMMEREDLAFLFFPAIPYGLIKYLQMRDFGGRRQQDVAIVAVCVMLCVCDLVILLQAKHWITAQRMRAETEALKVRTQAMEDRYSQEQEKIREINRIYHDMKHHLNYIISLSDNGKIREYIGSLIQDMEPCQVFPSTGNEVIDSVLLRAGSECTCLGIRLIPSIEGKVFGFMEPKDLLVIFGNALDNAREAVGKMEQQEDREIVVRAVGRKRFGVIRVENRFLGQLAFDHIGEAVTTKEGDGHGYGLKNMRSAARKYGGEVSVETREGRFILTVVIPMSDSGGEEEHLLGH